MGMEFSQQECIDMESLDLSNKFYECPSYKTKRFNCQNKNGGTMNLKNTCFIESLTTILEMLDLKHPRILEVASGNGYNTDIVYNCVKANMISDAGFSFIATDLLEHQPSFFNVEPNMASEKAVEKYGDTTDVLLLISPPPNVYVDFYAIRTFELIHKDTDPTKQKYVIFFGELGASDGGPGMYNYMINGDTWKLLYRKVILSGTDMFDGQYDKELFLWSLIRNP